jgi:hypothetical protein
MYSGSILAAAAVVLTLIPSLVSAEEVTPQSRGGGIKGNSSTTWLGFAVSPNRRVFKSPGLQGEASARNSARSECEVTTLRTCSAIAVPESADVAVVGCTYNGRSDSFVGGSAQNLEMQIALGKASDKGFPASSCVEIYTY